MESGRDLIYREPVTDEVNRWQALGSQLGFRVIAPATLLVEGESVTFTALLPQLGGENGMIADPQGETIIRYADALRRLGYGYSVVELGSDADAESAQEMLRDWGWSGREPRPLWW